MKCAKVKKELAKMSDSLVYALEKVAHSGKRVPPNIAVGFLRELYALPEELQSRVRDVLARHYAHDREMGAPVPHAGARSGVVGKEENMGILEAISTVSRELWLAYLRAKSTEVRLEIIRAARDIARDKLLAMEGMRNNIGPHLGEMVRLEVAWARLTQALEEVDHE